MRKLAISLQVFILLSILAMFTFIRIAEATEILPTGLQRIRADLVWDYNNDLVVDTRGANGTGISIAVIDTGIDYWTDNLGSIHYHPDLTDNILGGKGFRYWAGEVEERLDHEDGNGHGTHVAGTVAAVDNAIGVMGTAPKAKIYALRLFSIFGGWEPRDSAREAAAAINYAVNYLNVNIISISLGWAEDYPELRQAVDNAYAAGRLIIAAAGNENGPINFPARYANATAVGAVDQNDIRWVDLPYYGSNYGPELDFVAPGVGIYSTWVDEGYSTWNGTSTATPHVTAAAALIWSSYIDPKYDVNPQDGIWQASEVRQKLIDTALDLGDPGWDQYYGYGLVNAWYANQRPPGDIAGSATIPPAPPDNIVNYRDLAWILRAWGSHEGGPNYYPIADITIDKNVNYQDLDIVLMSYGKVYP